MTKLRTKLLGLLLCLTVCLSILPAQATTVDAGLVTREQAVADLMNTVGLEALVETQGDLSVFADAAQVTDQYVDEMGIAVANGILSGASGKLLYPKRNITRLEFARIVSRSMRELPTIKDGMVFSDVPASAAGDVNRLVKAGLMSGYGNGKFGVDDYLTQVQMTSVLNKIEGLAAIRPQDDFYYAVNHEWLSNTKLPAGYPGLMSFDEVDRSNTDKLKVIAKELLSKQGTYAQGTKEQKMADFYSCILDMENRNKQGIEPIKKYLDQIDGAKTAQELLSIMSQMEAATGMNPLIGFGPSTDLADSSRYILYGGGLSTGLPSAYMLMDNPQIKALYEGFLAQLLVLSGLEKEDAATQAQKIYDFEKVLAAATMTNEQASKIENMYNLYTIDDLAKLFTIDIKKYIAELGYGSANNLIVPDVNLMKKTGELFTDENLSILKAYARVHLVMNTASYLSQEMADVVTGFSSTFLGITSAMSQEETAFNMLNSVMSSYLGRMYVEKYFSAEAKKDVESIVADIIAAYGERIEKLDWMSSETKAAAINKLKTIKVKIGYPDTWNDPLANINLITYKNGGSLLGNIFAINAAQVQYYRTLLDKPVDKSAWMMPPHMVNAYYSATNNEIVFPAGILQAPFYDLKATREQNLGGIGTIIAHEITHAFDNNGAQFDDKGNMKNWWTASDFTAFQGKCQSVINLYQGLEIAPDAIVNGSMTLSENVSDIGAMACILDIAKRIPNANYKQLFETNATIWRFTGTSQMYQLLASQDVHAPNKFRVNRVLMNFQEFYDTYDIKPGDALYMAPESRVKVW